MQTYPTHTKGITTELLGVLAFQKRGYYCSTPVDPSCRYDFIVDIEGKLLRIQSKTSSLYKNKLDSIIFSTCRTTTNTKETIQHTYTANEIDYFYTHYNGYDFLIPVEEIKGTSKILRLTTPLNRNILNINIAYDYLIDNVLNSIIQNTTIEHFIDRYIVSIDPNTGIKTEWSETKLETKFSERQIRYIKQSCNTGQNAYGLLWKYNDFPVLQI